MLVFDTISALLLAALLGAAGVWMLSNRRSRRERQISRFSLEAQAALWRHPAGRSRSLSPESFASPGVEEGTSRRRPRGPDDDPEFISALERMIRGEGTEPV